MPKLPEDVKGRSFSIIPMALGGFIVVEGYRSGDYALQLAAFSTAAEASDYIGLLLDAVEHRSHSSAA